MVKLSFESNKTEKNSQNMFYHVSEFLKAAKTTTADKITTSADLMEDGTAFLLFSVAAILEYYSFDLTMKLMNALIGLSTNLLCEPKRALTIKSLPLV